MTTERCSGCQRAATRYALEPLGQRAERAATESALVELVAEPLNGPDPIGRMIAGVHVGDHLYMAAVGIGIGDTNIRFVLAPGMIEADKHCRVNGRLHLSALRDAFGRHVSADTPVPPDTVSP